MREAKRNNTTMTPLVALQKLRDWCAYQERCQKEVVDKLYEWKINSEKTHEILANLISEGFINEERFACTYVRGKFRIKKWGRLKIRSGLKQREISEYSIRNGMREIDEKEYRNTAKSLLDKKWNSIKSKNTWEKKGKVMNYLMAKGYEQDLIMEWINEMENDNNAE
jgi:regulatory protein